MLVSNKKRTPAEIVEVLISNICIDNWGCWIWQKKFNGAGYGTLGWGNKIRGTHRVSYAVFYDKIPSSGTVVMHCCDNKKCCNPSHLSLGTQRENSLDCVKKGGLPSKQPRGVEHWAYGKTWKRPPINIVSASTREDIKRAYAAGLSTRTLARDFGINQTHIRRIVSGNAPLRQFSPSQISEIVDERARGLTANHLGKKYGVNAGTIRRVLRKERYANQHQQ